ncbi:MAG: hypothetical protein PHU06_06100 [Gallionella sp.]|nr:hypothetical protein [Gallionella sp.]MDD4958388.1 hypothetical protein [Gallionella sp.]
MSNTSTQAGYLTPVGALPLADDALTNAVQAFVANVAGLPPTLVFPRWQATLPVMPEATINWCAVGLLDYQNDGPPIQLFGPSGMQVQRQGSSNCLCSFYGPNAQGFAETLFDGASLGQNRAVLQAAGLDIRRVSGVAALPQLLNSSWQKRYDISLILGVSTIRVYQIESLLRSQGTISTSADPSVASFDTENSQ